ncbi:unnamed protein product [Caenorhabditis bovis]|uniref:Uncharacterized protein n=1 Tax=Caenorhabditis bovis TaxID=2654633 RepID=A0A8S1EF85_9PELO|nr:unnamed protein product [Caenorhabditis bovis]
MTRKSVPEILSEPQKFSRKTPQPPKQKIPLCADLVDPIIEQIEKNHYNSTSYWGATKGTRSRTRAEGNSLKRPMEPNASTSEKWDKTVKTEQNEESGNQVAPKGAPNNKMNNSTSITTTTHPQISIGFKKNYLPAPYPMHRLTKEKPIPQRRMPMYRKVVIKPNGTALPANYKQMLTRKIVKTTDGKAASEYNVTLVKEEPRNLNCDKMIPMPTYPAYVYGKQHKYQTRASTRNDNLLPVATRVVPSTSYHTSSATAPSPSPRLFNPNAALQHFKRPICTIGNEVRRAVQIPENKKRDFLATRDEYYPQIKQQNRRSGEMEAFALSAENKMLSMETNSLSAENIKLEPVDDAQKYSLKNSSAPASCQHPKELVEPKKEYEVKQEDTNSECASREQLNSPPKKKLAPQRNISVLNRRTVPQDTSIRQNKRVYPSNQNNDSTIAQKRQAQQTATTKNQEMEVEVKQEPMDSVSCSEVSQLPVTRNTNALKKNLAAPMTLRRRSQPITEVEIKKKVDSNHTHETSVKEASQFNPLAKKNSVEQHHMASRKNQTKSSIMEVEVKQEVNDYVEVIPSNLVSQFSSPPMNNFGQKSNLNHKQTQHSNLPPQNNSTKASIKEIEVKQEIDDTDHYFKVPQSNLSTHLSSSPKKHMVPQNNSSRQNGVAKITKNDTEVKQETLDMDSYFEVSQVNSESQLDSYTSISTTHNGASQTSLNNQSSMPQKELDLPPNRKGPFHEMRLFKSFEDKNPYEQSFSEEQPELAKKLAKLFNRELIIKQKQEECHTPSSISDEEDFMDIEEPSKPRGPMRTVHVNFSGIPTEVPEIIKCHLCNFDMRICIRKSKYKGEIREYPAYRCLRKGCQTFRAIRKIIEPSVFDQQNWNNVCLNINANGSVPASGLFSRRSTLSVDLRSVQKHDNHHDEPSSSSSSSEKRSLTLHDILNDIGPNKELEDEEEEDVQWCDIKTRGSYRDVYVEQGIVNSQDDTTEIIHFDFEPINMTIIRTIPVFLARVIQTIVVFFRNLCNRNKKNRRMDMDEVPFEVVVDGAGQKTDERELLLQSNGDSWDNDDWDKKEEISEKIEQWRQKPEPQQQPPDDDLFSNLAPTITSARKIIVKPRTSQHAKVQKRNLFEMSEDTVYK